MTIVRIGATKRYSDGWESAFGKGKKSAGTTPSKKASAAKKTTKASAKKKAAKKTKK